jgi:hypothetical protein
MHNIKIINGENRGIIKNTRTPDNINTKKEGKKSSI